jgi:hypothetical protein
MITKTFFLAKDFRRIATKSLREKKVFAIMTCTDTRKIGHAPVRGSAGWGPGGAGSGGAAWGGSGVGTATPPVDRQALNGRAGLVKRSVMILPLLA